MPPKSISILWNRNDHATFESLAALETKIDELTLSAQAAHRALCVEVQVDAESALLLTIGGEVSHLEYYSATSRPPVEGCRGPWDDSEIVEFDCKGEASQIARRYCVPASAARIALQAYVSTGLRPTNIDWGL